MSYNLKTLTINNRLVYNLCKKSYIFYKKHQNKTTKFELTSNEVKCLKTFLKDFDLFQNNLRIRLSWDNDDYNSSSTMFKPFNLKSYYYKINNNDGKKSKYILTRDNQIKLYKHFKIYQTPVKNTTVLHLV